MIKVGVLRGGPNNDYETSLRSGQSVLDSLSDNYEARDILIDRNSHWFLDGIQVTPEKSLNRFDLVFNCLHGSYGEDGKVQRLLDSYNIPYTGSGTMNSAIAINKHLAKRNYLINGFSVPRHEVISVSHDIKKKLKEISNRWSIPLVTKPLNGSNLSGVTIIKSFAELENALSFAFEYSSEVIVEEYIRGRGASCCVLENFRGKDLYTFFPAEASLVDRKVNYVIPGRFSIKEKEQIQELAKKAHKTFGLRHYSKSDFVVSPKDIYVLKSSTLPDLDAESLYSNSLESIGSTLEEFTNHVVNLALS